MTRTPVLNLLSVLLLAAASLVAQATDFDVYLEFRNWIRTVPNNERISDATLVERYATKLEGDGLPRPEVESRVKILKNDLDKFEAEYWNRGLTADKPTFNTAPNAFLVAMTNGRKPGTALDVGMGEGRNALYLAKQGWTVTGTDFAERALALARQRAKGAGLGLETILTANKDYDFGKERWDLVLFSYVGGLDSIGVERIMASLKPGGLVIVEGLLDWWGENGLLRLFPEVRVLHYEESAGISDFHQRRATTIVKFAGQRRVISH